MKDPSGAEGWRYQSLGLSTLCRVTSSGKQSCPLSESTSESTMGDNDFRFEAISGITDQEIGSFQKKKERISKTLNEEVLRRSRGEKTRMFRGFGKGRNELKRGLL